MALCLGAILIAAAPASAEGGRGRYPPYRAGEKIAVSGSLCTAGFATVNPTTGERFGLTAGHCGARGPVNVRRKQIGSMQGSRFLCCRVSHSDSALFTLRTDETSATILGSSARFGSIFPVVNYFADSGIHRGMRVCSSGAFGGMRCGKVFRTDFSYRFQNGRKVTGLFCAEFKVKYGDSGGPVFALENGDAIAAGLVSLGGRRTTCFARIEDALEIWGVSLLVNIDGVLQAADPALAVR